MHLCQSLVLIATISLWMLVCEGHAAPVLQDKSDQSAVTNRMNHEREKRQLDPLGGGYVPLGRPKSKNKKSKRSISDDLDLDSLRGGEIPLKRDLGFDSFRPRGDKTPLRRILLRRGGEIPFKRDLGLDLDSSSLRGGEIPLKRSFGDVDSLLRGGEIPLKRDLGIDSLRGGEILLKRNGVDSSLKEKELSFLRRELAESFASEERPYVDSFEILGGGEIPMKRGDAEHFQLEPDTSDHFDDDNDDHDDVDGEENANSYRRALHSFINKLVSSQDWDSATSSGGRDKRSIRKYRRGGEIPMKRHLASNNNRQDKNEEKKNFDSIDQTKLGFRRNLDTIDQTTFSFKRRNFDSVDQSTFGRKRLSNGKSIQSEAESLGHGTHKVNPIERLFEADKTTNPHTILPSQSDTSKATQGQNQGQAGKGKRHLGDVAQFDSIEHQSPFGDFDANVISKIASGNGQSVKL